MFITFEGLDFSGKSTQVKLFSDRLSRLDFHVLVLREPGGTELGEKIRKILLDKGSGGMTDTAELFLFSASRAQLVDDVIRPALDGGMVVVCDRFFDSTTAYQGWGRGIPLDAVRTINATAVRGLVPDLTFFIDIPVAEVERRMARAHASRDRMEMNDVTFYERARNGYLELAREEARYRVVNGARPIDDIHEEIWQLTEVALEQRKLKVT